MIQKSTILNVSDSCGVWTVNTFHIYRGFKHKTGLLGNYIKISVRSLKPKAWLKKGKKSKAIFINSKFKNIKKDGSFSLLENNNCVLLKKRVSPRGKEIFGPIFYRIKKKKFRASFAGTI